MAEVLTILRPKVRPKDVLPKDWITSKCDKSPTGSHVFKPGGGELRCYFCKKIHKAVHGNDGL